MKNQIMKVLYNTQMCVYNNPDIELVEIKGENIKLPAKFQERKMILLMKMIEPGCDFNLMSLIMLSMFFISLYPNFKLCTRTRKNWEIGIIGRDVNVQMHIYLL